MYAKEQRVFCTYAAAKFVCICNTIHEQVHPYNIQYYSEPSVAVDAGQ